MSDAGHASAGAGWPRSSTMVRMRFPVRAITLDLDDTVWPFAPIGERVERVLDDWLRTHSPATAERYPVDAMRALRERVWRHNPQLAHDLSTLRRMTLEIALKDSGADMALLEPAYEAFYAARNEVEHYPDSLDALAGALRQNQPVAVHSEAEEALAQRLEQQAPEDLDDNHRLLQTQLGLICRQLAPLRSMTAHLLKQDADRAAQPH